MNQVTTAIEAETYDTRRPSPAIVISSQFPRCFGRLAQVPSINAAGVASHAKVMPWDWIGIGQVFPVCEASLTEKDIAGDSCRSDATGNSYDAHLKKVDSKNSNQTVGAVFPRNLLSEGM